MPNNQIYYYSSYYPYYYYPYYYYPYFIHITGVTRTITIMRGIIASMSGGFHGGNFHGGAHSANVGMNFINGGSFIMAAAV